MISFLLFIILFIFNDLTIPKKEDLFKDKKIIGVFSHPDDEVLISGTLLKYNKPNTEIYLLCLTKGGASEIVDKNLLVNGSITETREEEYKKATKLLGVKDSFILDFDDQKLGEEDEGKLLKSVLKYIRKIDPDVIITWGPDGFTFNPDHIKTSEITTKAFNIFKKEKNTAKLLYATVPENVHKGAIGRTGFNESKIYYPPNVRVNILGYTFKKYKIISQYKSQIPILEKDTKIPLWLLNFLVFNEYYYEVS